jgi:glutamyl-tRNA reductase
MIVPGRVRGRTALGPRLAPACSAAVELACDAAGPLAGRRALVVGTGQSAALSARALAEEGMELVLAARHRSRAADVAAGLGGAIALEGVPGELARADVVVAATGGAVRIIERDVVARAMAARGGRPLVVVDLGTPRDVDPRVGDLPGVTLLDLDDVDRRLDAERAGRRADRGEPVVPIALHRGRSG